MRFVLRLFLLVLLFVAGWLAWGLLIPARPSGQQFVLVRPGIGARGIAAELRNVGVIHSSSAFLLLHATRLRNLKAGEYLFEHPANGLEVYRRIAHGDIYFHTVTIPEGYNMFDVAGLVADAGLGSREDFLRAAEHEATLVHDLDPQARTLEGYLFPDTYRFSRTQNMHEIVATMVKRFRQEAHAIGLTEDVHRIVTMASIVEKETAAPEERATVAGVYYNRLKRGMALDADPSVIYASLLAGRYDGAIHRSDLQARSSYNTYKVPGLPPGPIANPGRASLEAAMHPVATDFFYFVSDNNGHHRFARSLEEHNRNVVAYRHAAAAATAAAPGAISR
jgi:UPF0755 protein